MTDGGSDADELRGLPEEIGGVPVSQANLASAITWRDQAGHQGPIPREGPLRRAP
jgi:hypothetical protein